MVRFLLGVLRRVLRQVLNRAMREALATAALHALTMMLTRAPMEWAFRTAGFALMSEALA